MQTQTNQGPLSFDSEDELIVQAEVEMRDGPTVTVGSIKITTEYLVFESTGALDIVLGYAGAKVLVDDIIDAQYIEEDRSLVVRSNEGEWCFLGRHIPEVSRKLQDFLAEIRDEPSEAQAYGEQYEFIHDMVDILEEDTVVGEGRIRVTDNRLQLTPSSNEATVRDAYAFDAPIDQIGDFRMNSIHSRLQVEVGNRRFEFGGPATSMVHEAICELLGTDPEDSLALSSRERSEVHRAKLPRFLWTYKGELHLGTHSVTFVPTGLFKAKLDPADNEILWSEMCSISIAGWPKKKLCVQGRASSIQISMKNQMHRFQDLVKTTFLAMTEQDKVARRSLALFVLDSWKKTIKWSKESAG